MEKVEKCWCLELTPTTLYTKFYAPTTLKSLLSHPYPNLYFQPRPLPWTLKHTTYFTSPLRCPEGTSNLTCPKLNTCFPFQMCSSYIVHYILANCNSIFLILTRHLIYSANPVSSSFKGLSLPPPFPTSLHQLRLQSSLTWIIPRAI